MKKCLAVFASLVLFSFVFIPHTNVYSQRRVTGRRYADDQIVVKLKAGAAPTSDLNSMAEEIVRAPGAKAEALTSRRERGSQLIHLNGGLSVEDAVQRAQEDPRVEYAEPDYFVYAMDRVPNDPFFIQMWGLSNAGCFFCGPNQPNINATKAWDITRGSDDIVVVVLDTGVELQHEDLSDNAWVNPGEIAGNGIDDDGNGFVDDVNGWSFFDGTNKTFRDTGEDFHGTHVAGSIGAVGDNMLGVTGVAWHVKLMSLKFLGGPLGKGKTSNAVLGINYAIAMRNRGVNVRVINASWGGGDDSQSLRQAIADANNAGILFVCAAGNGDFTGRAINIDDNPEFPASYAPDFPNAISVAAVNIGGSLASFSNFGHRSVSVAAPGVNIMSTVPMSSGKYGALNGTSMSTPYVSGIAVLLWSHEPSLTPQDVKARIVDTSQPLPSLVSVIARSGLASAYDALINTPAPPQPPEVLGVHFNTKKSVTIDGFGFANGSAIIEVDGVPLPSVDYDSSFALANGTLTELTAFLGKKPLKRAFPFEVQVSVRVINPTTGERSSVFNVTRF